MKLSFTDTNISVSMLEAGRVRLSSSSNVGVTTRDCQITTTGNPRSEFTVDTSCGNTFVAVARGKVELRAGGTVKQIAAGNQDTAGQARPGCTPER
jgi:ferric-dicitrate binding protein FerR (iron transport regulator)